MPQHTSGQEEGTPPVIPTSLPDFCTASTMRCLCSGNTPAKPSMASTCLANCKSVASDPSSSVPSMMLVEHWLQLGQWHHCCSTWPIKQPIEAPAIESGHPRRKYPPDPNSACVQTGSIQASPFSNAAQHSTASSRILHDMPAFQMLNTDKPGTEDLPTQ